MLTTKQVMEPTNGQCCVQPSVLLLILTLLVTSAATGLLCRAIMTDHWEYITWDKEIMDEVSKEQPRESRIDWLLNGKIARVNLNTTERASLFFAPMFGGLWTMCPMISDEEQKSLHRYHFPADPCINYLIPETMLRFGAKQTDWQNRMQNLSISCALVCLIILGSSALVGAFGVLKQQISAVLVTGVMYLLAATFTMFSLAIIHFKHPKCSSNETTMDGVIPSTSMFVPNGTYLLGNITRYYRASVLTTGWSLHMGWGGVATCVLASVLWIMLSKIMRYNPLSSLLTTLTVL